MVRQRLNVVIGLGLWLGLQAAAQAQTAPVRTRVIDGGRIAIPSPAADGVTSFKGLPYAAAPVGPLRWRPPAPVVAWRDVRSSDHFAPDCMQKPSPTSSPATRPRSEDCLYLNVWSAAPRAARQPVFVWFHGGGSRVGSGAQPQYDGAALARRGVVVVTVNYRLGPLGFLASRALSAESGYGASGNYGFMDDIAALRWVQRNIAQFGGDPKRVTIGGESSGSVTTGLLMASPLAAGLFQQAIGESGSVFRVAELGSMGATGLAVEEARGDRLAAAIGAPTLAALRAVPADAILDAADKTGAYFNLPVVDGHVLPDAPWRVFESHRQNDVPLLVGWNSDEGSLQRMGPLAPLPELLAKYYGPAAATILPFYPGAVTGKLDVESKAAGENSIAYPTWKWAIAQRRFGTHPVYVYQFDRAPPLPQGAFGPTFDVRNAGAFHGSEMVYVFDTLASQPTWHVSEDDRRVAAQMSGYWANFIKTGDPNGAGLPHWPRYDPASRPQRMRIGLETGAIPDPDFAKFTAIMAAHRAIDPADPSRP